MLCDTILVAEHRLDRFLCYIVNGSFPKLVGNRRVGSRGEKNLHDFPGSLSPSGCTGSARLRHRTVEWCRTISEAGTIDVGTVLDKGLDCRGASETYGMVQRGDPILVCSVEVRALFQRRDKPSALILRRWIPLAANIEKFVFH